MKIFDKVVKLYRLRIFYPKNLNKVSSLVRNGEYSLISFQ